MKRIENPVTFFLCETWKQIFPRNQGKRIRNFLLEMFTVISYSKFLIYEYLLSSATIFMISKVYQGSCVCVCFWVTFTKYLHPYRILSSIWSRGIMIWPHLLFSVIFSSQRPPVLMNRRRFSSLHNLSLNWIPDCAKILGSSPYRIMRVGTASLR